MALPIILSENLNNLLEGNIPFREIDLNAKEISKKYRSNNNDGNRLVTSNSEAISYALSRMPATYESVYSCLNQIYETNNFEIGTVLDIGAGTGAATWALYNFLGDKSFSCFEREEEMAKIGKFLMTESNLSKISTWKKFDIIEDSIEEKFDFVVVSYMINELPKNHIKNAIEKLWNATQKVLLILEPGTPNGFDNIKQIRNWLTSNGANIIAPCTHQKQCPLSNNDWCQFSCRVQRSKVHKILKGGSSPFEDEKYSYIAFSKVECNRVKNRILRHPIINKGYSEYKVCCEDGIKSIKISKKDGKLYKEAKKKSAGDSLNI
ncbi:MAG: methyltransferase domain-containing protein [Clostridia bacterium]|nr:methyltransferase domain-containing protein [Clostridia bacterium]